jgi:uncharacterized glyoxalase superfamily protein PhnB
MAPQGPVLSQLNLVVQDVETALSFYRRLGLTIEAQPGAHHAAVEFPNGMLLELDSAQSVTAWDSGWRGGTGGSAIVGFSVRSREAVDALYADLVGAGYNAHQRPYDAFWGARFAIVDDPDGNPVGLMSPIEPERKFWPPEQPPAGA